MNALTKDQLILWEKLAAERGKPTYSVMADLAPEQLVEASYKFPSEFNRIREEHERAEMERLTKLTGK